MRGFYLPPPSPQAPPRSPASPRPAGRLPGRAARPKPSFNPPPPPRPPPQGIFLDALGEPQDSPRRSTADGLQARAPAPHLRAPSAAAAAAAPARRPDPPSPLPAPARQAVYTLPSGAGEGEAIRLVLTDGRSRRETLPCEARAAWCTAVLAGARGGGGGAGAGGAAAAADRAWCEDFLVSGAPVGGRAAAGGGSCCRKDGEWAAWCARPGAAASAHWAELCDPTSSVFAARPLVLDARDNETVLDGASVAAAWAAPKAQPAGQWRRLVEGGASPACEVLGARQRAWLAAALAGSAAPLKLIASGSVLAGALGHLEAGGTSDGCDGDEWHCWPRAQANVLHAIANASGCAVVLTGNDHISDIKARHGAAPRLLLAAHVRVCARALVPPPQPRARAPCGHAS